MGLDLEDVWVVECAKCALETGPAPSVSSTISRRGACATSAILLGKVDDQLVVGWIGTTCVQGTGNAIAASSTTLPPEISASSATPLNDVRSSPSTRENTKDQDNVKEGVPLAIYIWNIFI